jgi:hypothetical protein
VTYSGTVAADSPLVWFRLNEGGGTTIHSIGSDAITCVAQSRPGPQLGYSGIASDGGGISMLPSAIITGWMNTPLPANTGYTIEGWVWVAGQGPFGGSSVDLVLQVNWATISELLLGVAAGSYTGYLRDQNGSGTDVHGSVALTHNAWHHLAAVQHQSPHLKELYVDGTSVGTGTGNTAGVSEPGQFQLSSAGTPACPIVAEPAVYIGELAAGRIAAHAAAADSTAPPRYRNGLSGVCT